MKLRIRTNYMEEVEGLHNEYPYAFHHVDLSRTLIPWHWHEELEFDYILEGTVRVSTAGQTQEFRKGEGFFINSNIMTTMVQEGQCVIDSHLFHPIFLCGTSSVVCGLAKISVFCKAKLYHVGNCFLVLYNQNFVHTITSPPLYQNLYPFCIKACFFPKNNADEKISSAKIFQRIFETL